MNKTKPSRRKITLRRKLVRVLDDEELSGPRGGIDGSWNGQCLSGFCQIQMTIRRGGLGTNHNQTLRR